MGALDDAITANPQRYEGYTVTPQEEDNPNAQTTYAVTRDSDGTGLGAYATTDAVEQIINSDRQMISTLPKGLDYIPPLVGLQPTTPPGRETPPA